jgi:hypothetical protein
VVGNLLASDKDGIGELLHALCDMSSSKKLEKCEKYMTK